MAPMTTTTTTTPTLTQNGARIALQAAERHALELNVPMSIAVVDAHTHLLLFTRMDGANVTSINTAKDMAFTAAGHRIPTSSYQDNSLPGSTTSSIGHSILGRFRTLGGGVPIISSNGDFLGAIGCSSGTPQQNEAAAKTGRDAVVALVNKERSDEQLRQETERVTFLALWEEKEKDVVRLKEELERGSKRVKLDEFRIRKSSLSSVRSGGGMPGTPPEEGEILPSVVGEIALDRT